MRYDVFRAKGYDIGSEAVEGVCKNVGWKKYNRDTGRKGVLYIRR